MVRRLAQGSRGLFISPSAGPAGLGLPRADPPASGHLIAIAAFGRMPTKNRPFYGMVRRHGGPMFTRAAFLLPLVVASLTACGKMDPQECKKLRDGAFELINTASICTTDADCKDERVAWLREAHQRDELRQDSRHDGNLHQGEMRRAAQGQVPADPEGLLPGGALRVPLQAVRRRDENRNEVTGARSEHARPPRRLSRIRSRPHRLHRVDDRGAPRRKDRHREERERGPWPRRPRGRRDRPPASAATSG